MQHINGQKYHARLKFVDGTPAWSLIEALCTVWNLIGVVDGEAILIFQTTRFLGRGGLSYFEKDFGRARQARRGHSFDACIVLPALVCRNIPVPWQVAVICWCLKVH